MCPRNWGAAGYLSLGPAHASVPINCLLPSLKEQTQLRILPLAKGSGGKVLCPWDKLWEKCKRQSGGSPRQHQCCIGVSGSERPRTSWAEQHLPWETTGHETLWWRQEGYYEVLEPSKGQLPWLEWTSRWLHKENAGTTDKMNFPSMQSSCTSWVTMPMPSIPTVTAILAMVV